MEQATEISSCARLLAGHSAIAWDLDGTLIDHVNAPVMHQFIKDTPHLRHVIVTFRSHGLAERVFYDLSQYVTAPPPTAFEKLICIPNDMWSLFQVHHHRREKGLLIGQEVSDETLYLEWKGRISKENGLTVLVDDNTPHVMRGCDRYGVAYVNPDDLT